MYFKKDTKYLQDGRLEDVLALLQVLALDKYSHRSEFGLKEELSDKPKSAMTWLGLAWLGLAWLGLAWLRIIKNFFVLSSQKSSQYALF